MNLNMRFPNWKFKALTLSYDDGVIYDKHLIDILDEYGIKSTFNINSGLFRSELNCDNDDRRMTLDEAKRIYINSGHELAAHTYSHPVITNLRYNDILNEIYWDKSKIEKEFGIIVRGYAAPYGCLSKMVDEVLRSCGIVYQRTVEETLKMDLPEDWIRLNGTCHHNNPQLMNLAKSLVEWKPKHDDSCRMFYVWGHSYEFEDNDNWNVMENFCEYIGQRRDIWYATNIEIYNYVSAWKNLQTDNENKIIYNPSAITVWIEKNGKLYKVKSGEEIRIK